MIYRLARLKLLSFAILLFLTAPQIFAAAGDYDGDGRTDFAVWRAGDYYILQNSNLQQIYRHFGIPGDIPVASVFVR